MEQNDECDSASLSRIAASDLTDSESIDDNGRRRTSNPLRTDRTSDHSPDLNTTDNVSNKKRRIELAYARIFSSTLDSSEDNQKNSQNQSLTCSANPSNNLQNDDNDFIDSECNTSPTDQINDQLSPAQTTQAFADRLNHSPSSNVSSSASSVQPTQFTEALNDSLNVNATSSVSDRLNLCHSHNCNHRSSCTNKETNNTSNSPNSSLLNDWLFTFQRWTHAERLAALESLVNSNICDIQEIRHLLSIIEPQLQRDFISLLPKELALYVLSFLDPTDLLQAAQTCRYWRILCEDNLLWREKCREEGLLRDNDTLTEVLIKRNQRIRHLRDPTLTTLANTVAGSSATNGKPFNLAEVMAKQEKMISDLFQRSEYKMAYLRQHAIEYNWRYGRFPNEPIEPTQPVGRQKNQSTHNGRMLKEILHLKGHDDHVITCLQFNPKSNLIVSGSDDNTLKVWSSLTGRCLRTLTGHTGGVWSSQLSSDNIVISGSTDRTLKVWNANTGVCMHTLFGHTSTVRCMALSGHVVVSGSRDATLRVWDIYSGQCQHVLIGHMAAVRCVQFNGKIVVSGAYDYLVKVWDVQTESCLYTLEGHSNRVYSLQFDGENIVSGSLDTSIKVWSASTGQLKHTLVGHQSLTSGMQLKDNILVSGNADSTVKVWDINTGDCLQTLAGPNKHQSAVTCLQFNSRFVITSSDDGTVKLWDLKTGEFIRNLVSLGSGGSGGVVWRIRASNTRLVCAVGSRNGTEDTAIKILNMDPDEDREKYFLHAITTSPLTSIVNGLSALSSVSI